MKTAPGLPVAFAGLLLSLSTGLAHAGPAGIDGLWCGAGLLHEFRLDLTQLSAEEVSGTLSRKQRRRELRGRLEGKLLHTQTTKVGSLVLELDAGQLRIVGGDGPLALAQGQGFIRSVAPDCGG